MIDDVNLQRQVQLLCHAAEPDGQRKDRVEAGGTQQSISDGGGGGGTESVRWVDLGSEKTTGGGAMIDDHIGGGGEDKIHHWQRCSSGDDQWHREGGRMDVV